MYKLLYCQNTSSVNHFKEKLDKAGLSHTVTSEHWTPVSCHKNIYIASFNVVFAALFWKKPILSPQFFALPVISKPLNFLVPHFLHLYSRMILL
jgi:hypothetical protein